MGTDTSRPAVIPVQEDLRLSAFDPESASSALMAELLTWYQDAETLTLIDGPNASAYDLDKLTAMYTYMTQHGELYLIERLTDDSTWHPIGEVGLQAEATPIVIAPSHRRQGVGRAVLLALMDRARGLGWRSIHVSDIYSFNKGSQRLFESLGFVINGDTELGHSYVRDL